LQVFQRWTFGLKNEADLPTGEAEKRWVAWSICSGSGWMKVGAGAPTYPGGSPDKNQSKKSLRHPWSLRVKPQRTCEALELKSGRL